MHEVPEEKKGPTQMMGKDELSDLVDLRVEHAMNLCKEKKGDRGLVYWEAALEIVHSIRGKNHAQSAKLYLGLAGTLQVQGEFHRAREAYSAALEIFQTIDHTDHGRYSKGTLQALLGLGTTNLSLKKYNAAVDMLERAARVELYIQAQEEVTPQSHGENENEGRHAPRSQENAPFRAVDLSSAKYLKRVLKKLKSEEIQENHKSAFDALANMKQRLNDIQMSVRRELSGDNLYSKGRFEAARYEFDLARKIERPLWYFENQVTLDGVWLARKHALAKVAGDMSNVMGQVFHDTMNNGQGDLMIDLNRVLTKRLTHSQSGFDMVWDHFFAADQALQQSYSDRRQLQRAIKHYVETTELSTIIHSVHVNSQEIFTESPYGKVLDSVLSLQDQLVPDGLATPVIPNKVNVYQLWTQLKYLENLARREIAIRDRSLIIPTMATSGNQPSSGLWLSVTITPFLLVPLALFLYVRSKSQKADDVCGKLWWSRRLPARPAQRVTATPEMTSPRPEQPGILHDDISSQGVQDIMNNRFLQLVDILEACINETSVPTDEKHFRLAAKVSAQIALEKTRKSLLAHRHDIEAKAHFLAVIDRLVDLGYGATVASTLRHHQREGDNQRVFGHRCL